MLRSVVEVSMLRLVLTISLAWLTIACRKHEPPKPRAESFVTTPAPLVKREWGKARFDVCALLTAQEVAEAQNSQIGETKSAGGNDESLFISQCFYMTPSMDLSVEISVIEKDPNAGGDRTPRTLWEEMFSDKAEHKSGRDREGAEQEVERKNRPQPQKIAGVGDDAYWVINALYALKGDRILRIGISGSGTAESKRNKATTLARKALDRM